MQDDAQVTFHLFWASMWRKTAGKFMYLAKRQRIQKAPPRWINSLESLDLSNWLGHFGLYKNEMAACKHRLGKISCQWGVKLIGAHNEWLDHVTSIILSKLF